MTVNGEGRGRRSWDVLALVVAAQFMVVVDITIVNVALPSIGRALGVDADDLSWVVTAYVLSSGGLLLVGGRLADLLGRRTTFMVGSVVFASASLACGLAPSAGALVAARAVQGAGAALLTPSALAILTTTYAGPQRARAVALWGAVGSAGVGVGVIAGGVLTTALGWEWVFWVNVPIGAAAALVAPRVIARDADGPAGSWRALDLPGALTSVGGLVALVYALSTETYIYVVPAAVLLVAFAAIERRAPRPLLAPAVWRTPALAPGTVAMLCATGLIAGTFFLTSVQLQGAMGWSALDAGLGFLPLVAAIALGVHVTSHAVGRVGTRALVVAGAACVAAGAAFATGAPAAGASYAGDLLPALVALGLGFGITLPAVSIGALSGVGHHGAGAASGLMSTAHEVGAALGVAALSAAAGATSAYADGMAVAAVVAGVLAVGALVAAPAVRPAAGTRVGVH